VNPRVIDWSQLRSRLIWAYAGRPAACDRSRGGPGLTAWRVEQGSVVLRVPGGSITLAPGRWVLLPANGVEAVFAPEAEIVSLRIQATWPDGRPLFDPARPLVATALQAE
jgi:hypothetical protein